MEQIKELFYTVSPPQVIHNDYECAKCGLDLFKPRTWFVKYGPRRRMYCAPCYSFF